MNKKSPKVYSSKIIILACDLLVILPSVMLLHYLYIYGVNVILHDGWSFVPLVKKAINSDLSSYDLLAQHNEHRAVFPRLVKLAIVLITRYNTLAQSFFNWIVICLIGLLIFYIYRKKFPSTNHPKLLLTFLPISLLLFSFRQYEGIFLNVVGIYLLIFGAVITFSLLEISKGIDKWFALSFLGAILASFSVIAGLAIWPIGLFQLFISESKNLRKKAIWCFIGILVIIMYLYDYVQPKHHPLNYALKNPLGASYYIFTLTGAPFSYDKTMASIFGLALVIIALFILVYGYKERILRRNGIWLSLIFFVALSLLATTIARSGFGAEQALSSRYIPLTTIGIIGLYFLALSVSERTPTKSSNLGSRALLTLILVGLIVPYSIGWQIGQGTRYYQELGAYTTRTYRIQSDENLIKNLAPNLQPNASALIVEQIEFLKAHRLNVFSERDIDVSMFLPASSYTFSFIDTINGVNILQQDPQFMINSSKQKTITITGWAVDSQANDVAYAVFITIDAEIEVPTLYGLDRKDVAEHLENSKFRFSGYLATFSSSILSEGEHIIQLKIVSKDGVHYYCGEQTVNLTIY